MTAGKGMLLHGESWDVTALDLETRREMARWIEQLDEIDVVRSSTTGTDLSDENALVVLIVLDSFDSLADYRSQPAYQSMAQYIQPLGLYPDKMMQFNIEMPEDAPSLRPRQEWLLHGCQVDVSKIDDGAKKELIDEMSELRQIELVRTATAGLDLLAPNAISLAMFLDNVDSLRECREHKLYSAMTASIAREDLPTVAFSLQLRSAPW